MLIDNKRLLQKKNTILLQKVLASQGDTVEVIASKSNELTLTINKSGQKISYHSRYNPLQEAKTFIDKQMESTTEYVLLIGVGLGYNLKVLMEQYPNVVFSIFEPNVDVMKEFLSHFDLSKVKEKNLDEVFSDLAELPSRDKLFKKLSNNKSQLLINPIANRIYENEISIFNKLLKEYLSAHKDHVVTDLKFQSRWTINSIINFNEVLNSPNIFEHIDYEKFNNKPVLVVAAGPSLNDEIENIRHIKEYKKAYIFAVGSAINALINADIIPDALFTYDPQGINAKVVEKVKELNLPIPLVFGTSVGYETLIDYPGKKVHFFTNQDSISPNLVEGNSNVIVPDAPTITAITLFVISRLNVGEIFLVGQNLSITKDKAYADGIDYYANKNSISVDTLSNYKKQMSTTGEEVYTNDSYLAMRDVIQIIIRNFNLQGKIFNTTRNGLPIEGATYLELSAVLDKYLKENDVVETDIFKTTKGYDVEASIKNYIEFEKSFDEMINKFNKVLEVDHQIRGDFSKKIIGNAGALFNQFDKHFKDFEQNEFFLRVIGPTTRVQYIELINESKKMPFEKRPLAKMELFIAIYSKYIRTIFVAIHEIQTAFKYLKETDFGERLNKN